MFWIVSSIVQTLCCYCFKMVCAYLSADWMGIIRYWHILTKQCLKNSKLKSRVYSWFSSMLNESLTLLARKIRQDRTYTGEQPRSNWLFIKMVFHMNRVIIYLFCGPFSRGKFSEGFVSVFLLLSDYYFIDFLSCSKHK